MRERSEIKPVAGACVWHGRDMAGATRWQRQLSPAQLAELDATLQGALAAAVTRGLAWQGMTAADFPLPAFAPLAEEIRAELEDGSGILLLRGIDPGRHCIRQAARGGVSKLCSSPAVHNEMLRRRPDLAAALYEEMWRSRLGEEDATDDSAYPLPVWGVRGAKFTSHYSRTFIEAAQRRPEVSRLSPTQAEALDLLHELAEELCFAMSFAPGDIQFVNNHVIYHARTAFEDAPEQGADRLLLRLWMAVPNSRALPDGHEVLWRNIAAGALRGGIGQSGVAVG